MFPRLLVLLFAVTVVAFAGVPEFGTAGEPLADFARIAELKEANRTDDLVEAGERFLADHVGATGESVVLLYLGRTYHTRKQYQDSIRVLSRLLEEHADSDLVTEAAMQRGESYRLSEKYAEMLPDFQKALEGYREAKAGDDAAHAWYHIVQAYNYLGKTDEAKAEALLLIEDYPAANYAKNAARLMKLAPPAAALASGIPVGTEAPDIEMTILKNGAAKKLSDFRGKIVVLDFWASWCGPCQAPMARMQTYREKHPEWGDKVELIALSIDNTREAAANHLVKKGWNNTLNAWAGEGGFQAKPPAAYKVRGIPAVYVIAPDGKIAVTGNPNSLDVAAAVGDLLK